jgi:flagellar basal body P-ring protein FlgI
MMMMMIIIIIIIMNQKNKWEVVRDLTFVRGTRDNLLFRMFGVLPAPPPLQEI